jgi:glutamate-1-semialdehyde 2,1-aminomutase
MATTNEPVKTHDRDDALRERAALVLPGGMYGHQSAARMPEGLDRKSVV